jgi:hypothetical protein
LLTPLEHQNFHIDQLCSWRIEYIKNFCKLNNLCSSIENLLSFTCYCISPQYKFFTTTLPRYKSWPQPTNIICYRFWKLECNHQMMYKIS